MLTLPGSVVDAARLRDHLDDPGLRVADARRHPVPSADELARVLGERGTGDERPTATGPDP